jgi:hypothetical protein
MRILMISFFLGAGASNPFGFPMTHEFKEIISKELTNRFASDGNLTSEEKIILTTLKHQTYEDIEYVFEFWKRINQLKDDPKYSIIYEFLTSYYWSVQFKGLPDAGHDQGAELKNFLDYAEPLMLFLTKKLYNAYSSKEKNIEISRKIYTPLIEGLNVNPIIIFTTNYDSVIEQYAREEQYNLIDGFKYDQRSGFMKWKSSTLTPKLDVNKKYIVLHKLHGSLNWKQHKKHGIVKLEGVEKMMDDDWQYSTNLLIKPTLSPKEEEGEEPYRTLISKFRQKVLENDACIVIGYSFRDKRINEIFYEFLSIKRRMIIISPSGPKNFHGAFDSLSNVDYSSNCSFIEEKISAENITNLIDKIKSKL